ncbi:MAG: 4-hydroxyphenylpyruvate dioxygenase [Bdellovibrionaceae bacterium]|nr:4-hydroxyphenylpyruvate dioxygenase [Bdellovibrionales bacterium]MCB9254710.1 4-hydroxyphenylpyruvate dioxygenase [Pseudobdellovibrionaceae bacterium]
MTPYDKLTITDFDYIEFAVGDIGKAAELHENFGFERAASREIAARKLSSELYVQNDIKVLLSHSEDADDYVAKYVAAHGDGVCNIAFRCKDVVTAFETVVARGALPTSSPKRYTKDFGAVEEASIQAFGDVRHTFLSREGNMIAAGFTTPVLTSNEGFGLQRIDHVTCNVEQGERLRWKKYYEDVFGLKDTRYFDIHGKHTGLYSTVMQSPDKVIKMPFNEPTEAESQIQEFIDVHHGPGIQHIALLSQGILNSLKQLREHAVDFLEVPPSYYDAVPKRVPSVEESIEDLRSLGILVDGDADGYLLQIFSQPVVGPFFYEAIQRKGNDGFGEGNFQALFDAMEADQIRRGKLGSSPNA